MNYTTSYRHLDTANVASAGIIDFCPSLNLTLASDRATRLFNRPTTCRGYGIVQRLRLKRDEWCRLKRDAPGNVREGSLICGPHATAAQYIYVDDIGELWHTV